MPPEDAAVEELRERLRRLEEAQARVPPHGWEAPRAEAASNGAGEAQSLAALLEALRALLPRELSDQVTAAIRELLLLVRAILDLSLERLEAGPAGQRRPPVEKIEID